MSTLTLPDGDTIFYLGYVSKNGPVGYGKQYYDNNKPFYNYQSKTYEGQWDDDKYHGQGTKYHWFNPAVNPWTGDKALYEGQFENGKFHGYGKTYSSNGTLLYEGEWQCDKMNGYGKEYDYDGRLKRVNSMYRRTTKRHNPKHRSKFAPQLTKKKNSNQKMK